MTNIRSAFDSKGCKVKMHPHKNWLLGPCLFVPLISAHPSSFNIQLIFDAYLCKIPRYDQSVNWKKVKGKAKHPKTFNCKNTHHILSDKLYKIMFGNNLRGSTGFLFSLRVRCTARGRGHLHRLRRKEEALKIEMLDYKLIRPPPESSKVFSMAKFMSSWILFDVAVVEDLWVALTLFVSLWKLNLPACWKFDYGAGKILLLALLISNIHLLLARLLLLQGVLLGRRPSCQLCLLHLSCLSPGKQISNQE